MASEAGEQVALDGDQVRCHAGSIRILGDSVSQLFEKQRQRGGGGVGGGGNEGQERRKQDGKRRGRREDELCGRSQRRHCIRIGTMGQPDSNARRE